MENNELLKKLQATELEILIEFDRICKELGLRYSLSSGTLLGAVRHGGFIPWDDDVDVMMPREDYERFIKEAPDLLYGDKYELVNYKKYKEYQLYFAKLMNKKTTFIQPERLGTKVPQGVWLDIFPIDRFPDDEKIKEKFKKKYRVLGILMWSKDKKFRQSLDTKPKRMIAGLINIITKPISCQKWIAKEEKLNKAFMGDKTATITCADNIARNYTKQYSWFEEYTEIEFEGKKFSAISKYDEYLKAIYGDYMTLPPEDQRITHTMTKIDCERPYTDYVDERGKLKQ